MSITRQLSLSLGDARTKFRQYTVDEDTTNPAHTDAQVNRILMDVYQRLWQRGRDDRIVTLTSAGTWGTITAPVSSGIHAWAGSKAVMQIKRVYNGNGVQMRKMSMPRLMWLQKNRPQASESLVTAYALERVDNESTTLVNSYAIRLWPLVAGTNQSLSADVTLQAPITLTADGDLFDMDVEEANIVVRVAAAIAAARLGRDAGFVESIWRLVPGDVQEYLGSRPANALQPKEAA